MIDSVNDYFRHVFIMNAERRKFIACAELIFIYNLLKFFIFNIDSDISVVQITAVIKSGFVSFFFQILIYGRHFQRFKNDIYNLIFGTTRISTQNCRDSLIGYIAVGIKLREKESVSTKGIGKGRNVVSSDSLNHLSRPAFQNDKNRLNRQKCC